MVQQLDDNQPEDHPSAPSDIYVDDDDTIVDPNPEESSPKRHVLFTGDYVRLAGQMDYPTTKKPAGGYPLIFIIQHATCNSRQDFAHISRLGNELGMAVWRWDKRGTGKSGSGSQGSMVNDILQSYKVALKQPEIDLERVIIMAQNEGTLILGEHFNDLMAIHPARGTLLVGNMLDEKNIRTITTPSYIVMSKNDWNAWQTYGKEASLAHARYTKHTTNYYVAPNTNRLLMYINGGTFHRGAAEHITEWLQTTCQIST